MNHVGGNAHKSAVSSVSTDHFNFPCFDLFHPSIKDSTKRPTVIFLRDQGTRKYNILVDYFVKTSLFGPNSFISLGREIIVTGSRIRSDPLQTSIIIYINVASSHTHLVCSCGLDTENVNHVLWSCTKRKNPRFKLLQNLVKSKLVPPFDYCYFS